MAGAIIGCVDGDQQSALSGATSPASGGPQLELIDSTQLQESDSAYIGRAREMAVDVRDGSYYVSDMLSERVSRFGRDGGLLMTYGRQGKGPAEITGIGPVLIGDSTLYVTASGNARIERYARNSGEPMGGFSLVGFVTSIRKDGERAWLGMYDPNSRSMVTAWNIGTDQFTTLIAVPEQYRAFPVLGGTFPGVTVATFGDSLLVGFMGTSYVVVAAKNGVVTDTIHIPAQRRRRYPQDLAAAMRGTPPQRLGALSALFHAQYMPTGEVALVYYDNEYSDGAVSSRVFVSVLSVDRSVACVDAEIPVSPDGLPVMTFTGDTLHVLEGRVEGQQVRRTVKRYVISSDGCDWLPTT